MRSVWQRRSRVCGAVSMEVAVDDSPWSSEELCGYAPARAWWMNLMLYSQWWRDDKDECLIKLLYYKRTSQLLQNADEYYITSDINNFII